jgi:NAD(P)-dependent dehydrogenase (short-subunit alcohol dehydrogenase family)
MHLTGAYRMAHRCIDKIAASGLPGGGSIVGIASMASYFGIEVVPGYGAAKTGLVGLTRALAVHWARRNVRVNAVAAGLTESRMTAATIANPEWAAPRSRVRRPVDGVPLDIAGAVPFRAPRRAGITGPDAAGRRRLHDRGLIAR